MGFRDRHLESFSVRALSLVAVGILLVAVDFRTEALDLLPDPIGWLLFAWGARMITLPLAFRLGVVAALLSISDLFIGFRYVLIGPDGNVVDSCTPGVGCAEMIRYDSVDAPLAVVIGLTAIVGGAAVITLLERLISRPTESIVTPTILRALQFAVGLVWVLPIAGVVGAALVRGFEYEPFWDDGLAFVAGAATIVMVGVAAAVAVYSASAGRTLEHGWSPTPTRLPKP